MSKNDLKSNDEKTPTILVVDDNIQNLELIQAYLEDMDCETLSAYDGREALEMTEKHLPDLPCSYDKWQLPSLSDPDDQRSV